MFSSKWIRRKQNQRNRNDGAARPRRTRLSLLSLEGRITPVRISSPFVDSGFATIAESARPANSSAWTELRAVPPAPEGKTSYLQLERFLPYSLDSNALNSVLSQAPLESNVASPDSPVILELPKPDGTMAHFRITNMPMMEPELAAQFPEIQTYRGQGIEDPTATLAADFTPHGFHAQVLSPGGSWYIDPYYHLDQSMYASYFRSDLAARELLPELPPVEINGPLPESSTDSHTEEGGGIANRSGTQLRTYRLACAATGEYTAFFGGTVALGQAAVVTANNRVSGLWEVEMSIRLTLVANNSLIIYTNGGTDPYTNNNGGAMLSQNQTTCDAIIGNANYDIGHVFSTGGGGVAGLGVVGFTGQKARGVTGSPQPVGDAFYVDYVIHEQGHQFAGNHSFNTPNAGGARVANRAYEPGSGSTIMAYAGITGSDDLQPNSDAYFHSISFDEIINFVDVTIPGVGTRTATGNLVPTVTAVTAGPYTIPTGTPFYLQASGTDGNGDTLTYNWEQRNLGPAANVVAPDNGQSPILRSWTATTNPIRYFPRLSNLLNNTAAFGEKLPTVNWPPTGLTIPMRFRVTVRDNRAGGGGVNTAGGNSLSDVNSIPVFVVNTGAGVFSVTSQNTGGINYQGNSTQTVTWNVAGTTAPAFNAANVNIRLSLDGGLAFPTVLAANTPNDGTEAIVLPNPAMTEPDARIKVEPVNNIFFDINNFNFTLTQVTTPPPLVTLTTINNNVLNQRSMVRSLEVTFNSQVSFLGGDGNAAAAFQVARFGGGNVGSLVATPNVVGGVTVVTLDGFDGAETQGNSLADGRYQLTVFAANVSNAGGPMASNYTFGQQAGPEFLTRMFGDWNGDRQVDGVDLGPFSSTYGLDSTSPQFLSAFDINDDNQIDGVDLSDYNGRYNTILP